MESGGSEGLDARRRSGEDPIEIDRRWATSSAHLRHKRPRETLLAATASASYMEAEGKRRIGLHRVARGLLFPLVYLRTTRDTRHQALNALRHVSKGRALV